jgi:formate dehydrogenase major subunit
MAECHPVGFQWVMEAKRRGATIVHVDPRFTRTSAMSHIHVPIRAGTDIAFLGGLVNYIISNERYFKEYVVNYTNAATIVTEEYRDAEDLDGLFSGWKSDAHSYDPSSWTYQKDADSSTAAGEEDQPSMSRNEHEAGMGSEHSDPTLQHPRCVFQILKRHYARYTPEVVEQICGIAPEEFIRVAQTLCANSGRERTTALCYAVGWTQQSVGVQYIRAGAIVQLLLGNIGRPGGGILALRGHASIQGSTDIPTLFNLLPGYLPMPKAAIDTSLSEYVSLNRSTSGWWTNFPKYIVSLLKAYFGEAATEENDFCFDYLPRLTGDHSHQTTTAAMADGKVKGYFVMGQNPAVGSPNGGLQRKGLRELEWLVVRDLTPTETAEFWREAPEIERGEVTAEEIRTEVFFFPAAAHTEKDGSFTNTQRLLQWHHAAVEPPGEARSELHFMYHLGLRVKQLYEGSEDAKDLPVLELTWTYPTQGARREPSAEAVLAEVSGFTVADGKPVDGFLDLKEDGSTACGAWIYSGSYKGAVNQTARRVSGSEQSWVAPEWGWAWPNNRRILYNRASADPDGKPWSERKKYVWWDEEEGRWVGYDNPDYIPDRAPSYRPPADAAGIDALAGTDPFIMQSDGKGWLFAPRGLLDGPLPTHYEPQESVIENPLYAQQCNPARMEWERPDNAYHRAYDDPRYPYAYTTYRLTEHHTAGGMSRWLSWLSELQPEMFCEVSPDLAAERGLTNGGWATISTARAQIEARVLVTHRLRPLKVGGRSVHQIGLPYHWGRQGLSVGDSTNDLSALLGDPNTSIQNSKAMTADVRAGRLSRNRRAGPPEPPGPPPNGDAARDLEAAAGSGHHGHKSSESGQGSASG